jgi:hypothetical protein
MVQPNGTRIKGKIGSVTLQFTRVWGKTCAYLSATPPYPFPSQVQNVEVQRFARRHSLGVTP